MSVEVAEQALIQTSIYTNYISLSGLSEPLLCKNFLEILELCVKFKTHVRITTNADILEDFIDEIDKLINLTEPYEKGNISNSLYSRAKLQVNSYDSEKQHIERIEQWGHFKAIHFVNPIDTPMKTFDQHQKVFGGKGSNRGGALIFTNQKGIESPCFSLWNKALIDWDGGVDLCSQKWYDRKKFGNIMEKTFQEIWEGEEINKWRKGLVTFGSRCNFQTCLECDSLINHEDGERLYTDWKNKKVEKVEY